MEIAMMSLLSPAQVGGFFLLVSLGVVGWAWASRAQAEAPRPEHPRPDFRREAWLNLNGTWSFDFDPEDVGEKEGWFRPEGHTFTRSIRVPFPWEAPLSGVADTAYQGAAWYQRPLVWPAEWTGQRIILKFGAVDWQARIWINDTFIGEHSGGYTPFEFDITDVLQPAGGEPSPTLLTVRAFDNTSPEQPTGKQSGWYTRTSGIWQTVYLEARPATFLEQVHVVPSLARRQAEFRVAVVAEAATSGTLVLETDPDELGSAPFPRIEKPLSLFPGRSEHTFTVDLPDPQPWSPATPNLYFVRLTLTSPASPPDVVHTYFGLRDIGTGRFAGQDFQYITLNGQPIYLLGALDQSFHPEGIYTFPSDEVARMDIVRAKEFGLNFLRLHIKVEEPRFLYWADRLGVLLMCDMPDFSAYTATSQAHYERTLRDTIARDFNHPSIFAWCLFNETWGLGGGEYRRQFDRHAWVRSMFNLAHALDPTRLVEDNSACLYDHVITDINSWHFYINDYPSARDHIAHVVANTFPGSPFNYAEGCQQADAPLINSEYGGISAGHGDQDISWCFKYLTNELRKHAKIGGYVYTELMDIEWEHNGFMNYDRTVKEFGYDEISPGFSLADLNNLDFLILDSPPCPSVQPGGSLNIPLAFSHFSGRNLDELVLQWRLDGLDADGQWWGSLIAGSRRVHVVPWTVVALPELTLRLPDQRMVGVLTCWVEDLQGKVVARNYLSLDVRDVRQASAEALPRRACPDPQTLVLRWQPGEFADTSWQHLLGASWHRPQKAWGHGAGYLEYRLRLPQGVEPGHLTQLELLFEGAAKAASEKVEWDRFKEIDYPQTDRTKWPSDVRISVNGVVVDTVTFPDDPADARGILSHASGFHPGSYGYLTRRTLTVDPDLRVAISAAGAVIVRFEVPADAAHVGGFALFGDGTGMYPLDPTLTLRFEAPVDVEQAVGDGSSLAQGGPGQRVFLPTGEAAGQPWRYTTEVPPEDWMAPGFDDRGWAEGLAGFGREGTPNTFIRTPWLTSDIWLRRSFNLPGLAQAAVLRFYHDEDMEIYLNGQPILQRQGYLVNYQTVELPAEALAHFVVGENVLAVHCHQTEGGQFIDVGGIVLTQ